MQPRSVEQYRLQDSLEALRKRLQQARFADRLDRPIAYWALASDRGLPVSLLGRSVRDLIGTPFERLAATPGIGPKKFSSLIGLLERAADVHPFGPSRTVHGVDGDKPSESNGNPVESADFDADSVSEQQWLEWRLRIKQFHLETEKLGRLVPSLQSLPTTIWHTSLGAYLSYTLAEIRQLRSHGRKRIQGILEVFLEANRVLSVIDAQGPLGARLAPRFVLAVEAWLANIAVREEPPCDEEIRQCLALPVAQQIYVDAGPTVHQLVLARLGIDSDPQNVHQLAKLLSVSRPRIYQYFEDCYQIMNVRWPEGSDHLAQLSDRLTSLPDHQRSNGRLNIMRDLFYPR